MDIENRISELKKLADTYDKMSSIDKIKNTDTYNKIMEEKGVCVELLNNYRKMLDASIDTGEVNDDNIMLLLERVSEIKQKMNDTSMSLNEIIELYVNLTTIKVKLDSYFDNKKIQIIKL